MDNPFKKILHQEELPKMLRKKVMDDVSFIALAIDIADLLAIKYPETIENLLRLKKDKN
jgi:hypothetical protein